MQHQITQLYHLHLHKPTPKPIVHYMGGKPHIYFERGRGTEQGLDVEREREGQRTISKEIKIMIVLKMINA